MLVQIGFDLSCDADLAILTVDVLRFAGETATVDARNLQRSFGLLVQKTSFGSLQRAVRRQNRP